MTAAAKVIQVLLVEDDAENLALLQESLPTQLDGYILTWEPCDDFINAVRLVANRRYDLIVTDIYRDRADRRKGVNAEDEKAFDIIAAIRSRRFCPIVAFTDGSAPQTFHPGPFVKLADKSRGDVEIVQRIRELLGTGVPELAQKLHDELDRAAGSYLWDFLEKNWGDLESSGFGDAAVLERIVRKRAAIQIGRLDAAADCLSEIDRVNGSEFYIWPPISGDELRLGSILRDRDSGQLRVVLTPHCHLTVQTGDNSPRADFILTVRALLAGETITQVHTQPDGTTKNPWSGSERDKLDKLRRRINSPAELGRPAGRYWFLPGFLTLPDSYCDLLQLESIPHQEIWGRFDQIAVLDTPFAEALQACFTSFYSAVGLPTLDAVQYGHLIVGAGPAGGAGPSIDGSRSQGVDPESG